MCVLARRVAVVDPLADIDGLGYEVSCDVNGRIGASLNGNLLQDEYGFVKFGANNCKRDIWYLQSGQPLGSTFYVRILGATGAPGSFAEHLDATAVKFTGTQSTLVSMFGAGTTVYKWSFRKPNTDWSLVGYVDLTTNTWGSAPQQERQEVETGDLLRFESYTVQTADTQSLYTAVAEPQ